MKNNNENEYLIMDERDAPYDIDECPYKFTEEDHIQTAKIFKELGLEFEPGSYMAKLTASLKD